MAVSPTTIASSPIKKNRFDDYQEEIIYKLNEADLNLPESTIVRIIDIALQEMVKTECKLAKQPFGDILSFPAFKQHLSKMMHL